MNKICALCGESFEAKSNRTKYCNKSLVKTCPVCGSEFSSYCNPAAPTVCSNRCAGHASKLKQKSCAICGELFYPNSSRQKYCKKEIRSTCEVCGTSFTQHCGETRHTCANPKCSSKYAHRKSVEYYKSVERECEWCGKLFHPVNNIQKYCNSVHYQTCAICGTKFEIDLSLEHIRKTCSDACAQKLKFIDGNPFSKLECREKAKQTMKSLYGVDHPMHSPEIVSRMSSTYLSKTGYDHPSHNPQVRSTSARTAKISKFELRVRALFHEYNIEVIHHYMISNNVASHEFDFYLPKYKMLIDCDGTYYHSYLDDPDGKHVLDYYDEDRLALVPGDHMFHVIVEGQEEHDIKYIINILKQQDAGTFDYEGDLFKWCRSIEFPYPDYDKTRILKDYNRLCQYHSDKYVPAAKLAMSAIHQFHKSIYDAHVSDYPSPREAWYDDKLLKKVITNRLIYKNDVDPFKILQGFNISKICPRVSIFNPVLAKYLVETYLKDYNEVFDPFSGFSGRLLGVTAAGKQYIGQDLNEVAVKESEDLAKYLGLSNYSLKVQNILESSGSFECLLTCPPYYMKEHYNNENIFKTCDDWITYILDAFKCKKYVFVVDNTDNYKDNVVETINSTSHLSKFKEQVIVI